MKSSFSKVSRSDRTKEVNQKLSEAEKIFGKQPNEALDLVHDALLICIKENYSTLEAEAYTLLGRFNYNLGEYKLSYKNYNKAITIYDVQKLVSNYNYSATQKLLTLYYPTGLSAEKTGDYENSLKYYDLLLNNAKSDDEVVKAHLAISNVYLLQKDFKGAQHHLEIALKIEKKRDNKKGLALVNLRLAELEKEKNNTEKALQYYQSSQNTAIEINDDQVVNTVFNDLSNIYLEENNIQEGIELNQQAIEYNQKINNPQEVSKRNIDLANFYMKQNKNEEAIQHLENTVEIADKTGDLQNKSKAIQTLSEVYNRSGQEEEAMEKYREYLALEDSIFKLKEQQLAEQNKKGEMLENAQNKLSLLEKDKQLNEKTIELLRQEKIIQEEFINKQKVITYSLIFGIIVLLVTSYLVYRSNKEKNKANQLLILKSLRAQMNPHFIFNALNSVNSFISKNDERAANRYLADFSKLMRDVMENSQEDFIPLSKEIDILSVYLKLEHHRFKDKFDYTFDVDDSINTEEYFIPPMLIQPYIENAVWHGLRYKEEIGQLNVSIQKMNDHIEVTIRDNGIGRKRSQELKTENQKIMKSTGLKNIDSRLKIISDIYKAKLDVTIEDVQPSGTLVMIKIYQDNIKKTEV
ncbi:MAG: histidine kinase [Flavobacteriales bacterium]|nr:histidine kinase [Flavobacteriales bacterium]